MTGGTPDGVSLPEWLYDDQLGKQALRPRLQSQQIFLFRFKVLCGDDPPIPQVG
jgi:hypothetical protein